MPKKITGINTEIFFCFLVHSIQRKQTPSHNTAKQGGPCQHPLSHAVSNELDSKRIASSQVGCAAFWKAFMLALEKSHFKEERHTGTHKSVNRRKRTACKKTGLAYKLFILRTKEVGRFALWGIAKFSSDSQPFLFFSLFFFLSFHKSKNDTVKRTAVEFKTKKREHCFQLFTLNLWNLWPEKTLLKLAVPSLNWAQCSGIHITTFCFSILT